MDYYGDCLLGVAVLLACLWVLWAGAEVCGGWRLWCRRVILCQLSAAFLMTSAEKGHDLVIAPEKLEWITPQISVMSQIATEGKITNTSKEINTPAGS